MSRQSISQDYENSSVAIMLATYNGGRFLAPQLKSLEEQDHQNWYVIASDDGSTDNTLEILKQYQKRWPQGKLTILGGPKQGFCANFLSMACNSHIAAEFYAFCDQDDVWLPAKLSVAISNIKQNQEHEVPYLYCGRTTYVDVRLRKLGFSPLYTFPRTFRNALIQSIAGGNTMVFNQKTKDLLERVGVVDHPSHDWWLYQLSTGAGGDVFYDPIPQVLYRQHEQALVGRNNTITAKIERISMVFKGQFRLWCDANIAALCIARPILKHGSKETLDLFMTMRHARLKDRFRLLEVAGLYRQTWRGTISLLLAALFKKI